MTPAPSVCVFAIYTLENLRKLRTLLMDAASGLLHDDLPLCLLVTQVFVEPVLNLTSSFPHVSVHGSSLGVCSSR